MSFKIPKSKRLAYKIKSQATKGVPKKRVPALSKPRPLARKAPKAPKVRKY